MSAAAFLFACAALASGLLCASTLDRRGAMQSARLRTTLGHEALRQGALALALTVAACALAFA